MKYCLIVLFLLISNIGYSQTTANLYICYIPERDTNSFFVNIQTDQIVLRVELNTYCPANYTQSYKWLENNVPTSFEYKNNFYILSDITSGWGTGWRNQSMEYYDHINVCYFKYESKPFPNFEPLVIIPKLYKRKIGA